jgi:hypothetical protein
VLREKYHQIRRINLFLNSFEEMIAGAGQGSRSIYRPGGAGGSYGGMDMSFVVKDKRLGVSYFLYWKYHISHIFNNSTLTQMSTGSYGKSV